jgi:hypothetical protein
MGIQPPSVNQGQAPASDSHGAALCLVFTDARGRIVFADTNFLELLCQDDTVSLVGEPLHKVLKAAPQGVSELIAAIARTGYVREHRIEAQGGDGEPLSIACTGVATYDDQGAFIGADVTICDVTHFAPTDPHVIDHGDILSVRIKEIQGQAEKQWIAEEETLALGYFIAQVSALQVLLGRMGGPRVWEMVETLVNQTANKHTWPVQLRGGRLIVSGEELPINAYALLLDQVVDYGVSIIGQQTIVREMQAVDEQMTDHLRGMADQAGLRSWLGG